VGKSCPPLPSVFASAQLPSANARAASINFANSSGGAGNVSSRQLPQCFGFAIGRAAYSSMRFGPETADRSAKGIAPPADPRVMTRKMAGANRQAFQAPRGRRGTPRRPNSGPHSAEPASVQLAEVQALRLSTAVGIRSVISRCARSAHALRGGTQALRWRLRGKLLPAVRRSPVKFLRGYRSFAGGPGFAIIRTRSRASQNSSRQIVRRIRLPKATRSAQSRMFENGPSQKNAASNSTRSRRLVPIRRFQVQPPLRIGTGAPWLPAHASTPRISSSTALAHRRKLVRSCIFGGLWPNIRRNYGPGLSPSHWILAGSMTPFPIRLGGGWLVHPKLSGRLQAETIQL